MGGAVGKNQRFCILLKIGSLDFFHILHKVRGHAIFAHFLAENGVFHFFQFLLVLHVTVVAWGPI